FSEIGLVMLIGLAAKNAILIVEYSKTEHERGASIADAALAGARLRLRPILMTALAFILGVLPLCMATGSGAASRRVLGTTYVGADALTIEEAVATPIEAQMTGVDNMLYMYSTSTTSGGQMNLRVVFDVTTDPGTDQVLAQMRYSQAAAQLPQPVTTQGVTV